MSTLTADTVAEVVRSAMKDARISQRELADRTGLPLVTLARRLSGQARSFTVWELHLVGEVVGLSLAELARRFESWPAYR